MYTIIPTKMAQNADMKTDRSPNNVYLATLNIGWSLVPLFACKTPIYIKFVSLGTRQPQFSHDEELKYQMLRICRF